MFRLLRFVASFLLSVLCAGMAFAAPRADYVFIVSLDGGKPAVMQESPMPFLKAKLAEGAGTWKAQTVFPSITLVAHTSMLTGVTPAKHKIDWNSWMPEKGLVTVPTVFAVARKQGLTTAVFAGKDKFKHLETPGSLDRFELPSGKAKGVAQAAAQYILEKKPNLCFIHFPDSDSAGHAHEWGSPEQVQAFADEDAALKVLWDAVAKAGIADDSVFIVSADHGGHEKTHGSRSPEDMTIPWIAWGKGVKPGFTITDPVTTYDTAATALWLLDVPVPADWDGKLVSSAFLAAVAADAKSAATPATKTPQPALAR